MPTPKAKQHYVDKVKFNLEATKYVNLYNEAKAAGLPKPQMSNYLGNCIVLIANKSSNMPSFVKYPFKDEMISDGIEIAFRYFHNYDEEAISVRTGKKSAGAFGYFTQIICRAFIKRICIEKRLMYLKQKYIDQSWDVFVDIQEHDSENYTEELKDMLQEMSGDDYKAYDAKMKLKHDVLAEELALKKHTIADELKQSLDIIPSDDIEYDDIGEVVGIGFLE
jgi:hypothetical protein